MASGAAWMVSARVIDKVLGLISTLILARLLAPADFGLVAMAVSIVALSELLSAFSFDTALVANAKPPESHYHTAWTLNVLFLGCTAILVTAFAYPASILFDDPRLVPTIAVLGLSLAIQGFENIGIVAFRKEMRFGKDFAFMLSKRVIGPCVTLPVAFATRSHWALVVGIVASRSACILLSYSMHPFRPLTSPRFFGAV